MNKTLAPHQDQIPVLKIISLLPGALVDQRESEVVCSFEAASYVSQHLDEKFDSTFVFTVVDTCLTLMLHRDAGGVHG